MLFIGVNTTSVCYITLVMHAHIAAVLVSRPTSWSLLKWETSICHFTLL